MKHIGLVRRFGALVAAMGIFMMSLHACAYTAKISIKSKYLGSIGTTVDDRAVLQPYIEFGNSTGFYGYFWANVPVTEGNPKNSAELEPSIGYRQSTPWFDWNASLTVFDMQSPNLLQYRQDVLSPSVKISKGNIYAELRYYGADRAEDGVLFGAGYNVASFKGVALNTSLVYVDAPFYFEAIAYGKVTATKNFEGSDWVVGLEMMGIFYFKDREDVRDSEFAVVVGYRQFQWGISFRGMLRWHC